MSPIRPAGASPAATPSPSLSPSPAPSRDAVGIQTWALPLSWPTVRTLVASVLGFALLLSTGLPARAALPDVTLPSARAFVQAADVLGEVAEGTVLRVQGAIYVGGTNRWRKVLDAGDAGTVLVGQSLVVIDRSDDDATTVKVFSLAGQLVQQSTVPGRFEQAGASGFIVSGGDADSYVVSYGSSTRTALGTQDYVDDWRLGNGQALARVNGDWRAVPLSGGSDRDAGIPGNAEPVFVGAAVVYSAYDAVLKQTTFCRASDLGSAFACSSVDVDAGSPGDSIDVQTIAGQGTVAAVLENSDTDEQLLVRASGSAARIRVPQTWADTSAGLEAYEVRQQQGSVLRLGDDGSASVVAVSPQGVARVELLSLSPNAVAGGDGRPAEGADDSTVWKRSLTGAALGPESLLPVRATEIQLSGSRMAVSTASGKTLFYDGPTRGRTVGGALASNLSGGQALILRPGRDSADLLTVDGRRLGTLSSWSYDPAIFGSRTVVERKNRLQVIDVAAGNKILATGPTTDSERYGIWGDWVVFDDDLDPGDDSDDSEDTSLLRAYNVRTKALKTIRVPASVHGRKLIVGDGFAALQVSLMSEFYAWDFAGSAGLTTVGNGNLAAVEGNRVGWIDDDGVAHVTTLPFGGRSAPRLLSPAVPAAFAPTATAANRWRPQFDLTKPTTAGQLRITSGRKLVRVLAVRANADGSIRSLSWDGKDGKGKRVKTGTYRWTLAVSAADGTGAARSIDGTTAPTGSVTVQATFAKAPKPRLSGAAKVGSRLTAKAGTWSPKATLSYQWLRNGSTIKNAKAKTYRLAKSDKGKVVAVTVTARRTGYLTTSRTSANTGKVR